MSPVAADRASAWSAPGLAGVVAEVVVALAIVVVAGAVDCACFELPHPARRRPSGTASTETARDFIIDSVRRGN
jgi:hypothetical protein